MLIMKTLLVVGNDYWGKKAAYEVANCPDCTVALDHSPSLQRVFRLIVRRRLSASLTLKMFLAELGRKKQHIVLRHAIRDNAGLLNLAGSIRADRVLLFRAGLIVNDEVLRAVSVENIHCALIPEFGGLGSIQRALNVGKFAQAATHHKVTTRIDEGEVLGLEPYTLSPCASYRENEDAAYRAGIVLLRRILGLEKTEGVL